MSDVAGAFGILLRYPLALLAIGLFVSTGVVLRARAIVGPVIAAEYPWSRARKATLIGLHVVVLALVLVQRDLPLAPTFLALALGAALAAVAPGYHDAVCGADGVRRGWNARRYEDMEEWRLISEHLRFRLFGEWTSVPLPAHEHPRIREKLLAVCAERESRFKD